MDQATLHKQLMATFLDELEENAAALNRDLLALEKDPTGPAHAERLRTLFRTAHSLKGAARAVNVELIESAPPLIPCAPSGSDPQRGPSSARRRAPVSGDATGRIGAWPRSACYIPIELS